LLQVTAADIGAPNWSAPLAANCRVPCEATVAVAGEIPIAVSVWFTVTFTLLVLVKPPASVIVTVKVYAPAMPKVAVVFFAAFVPLAEYVGAVAPVGTLVAAQV
jgi:hypothetical protein